MDVDGQYQRQQQMELTTNTNIPTPKYLIFDAFKVVVMGMAVSVGFIFSILNYSLI